MNILYISYRNMGDGLTEATVFPSLRMLRELLPDAKIVFANIQREKLVAGPPVLFDQLNILYSPIPSGSKIINKFRDFFHGPKMLQRMCIEHGIAKVIARGAPSGALAYLLWKSARIPFYVESFEPHSDYMLESGVWNALDPRYFLQKDWERKQKEYAAGLMPVACSYKIKLVKENVDSRKIRVVPCAVDSRQFAFDLHERNRLRQALGLDGNSIVGLYVGKYGGLYLAEDSFRIYKIFFEQVARFALIILSPNEYHPWVLKQINVYGLPRERVFVKSVAHHEVGAYCSMSDFAFATYKPGASKEYLSPVKVGEYWANGLPIFLTKGVGDEASMVENGFGGVLFDPKRINPSGLSDKINKLLELSGSASIRQNIAKKGVEHRSIDKLREAYAYFLFQK